VVSADDAYQADLLDAMTSLGYTFVNSTAVVPPAVTESRNYGSLAAAPTFPAPAAGAVYYDTTLTAWFYHTGAIWTPVFVGPVGAVANNLVGFDGATGRIGKDSGIAATTIVTTPSGKFSQNYTFNSQAQPYVSGNSLTYAAIGSFRFPGTTNIGTPTLIKAVTGRISGLGTGNFRLFDVTNAVVLAETTGIVTAFPSIVTIVITGAFSAAQAIIEVQLSRSGGAAVTAISALDLEF
jgi:hypothetical protein